MKDKIRTKERGLEIKALKSKIKDLQKVALEHRRLENELHVSETRFRRLFETAQDGILILEARTGRIVEANKFLIDMLGYSRNEFLNKRLWEIGAFIDIEKARAAFKTLQTKRYIRYENLPLQAKDGRLFSVEFVSNVYKVDHKNVIQCNIRDITLRKKAQETLKALEETYHSIFDSVTDAILIQDINTCRILDANKKACEMFCYPKKELLKRNGKVISENKPPYTRKEYAKYLDKAARKEPQVLEWLVRDKFGRQFWVETSLKRAIIGSRYCLLAIIRDITERKKAEELLKNLFEQRSVFRRVRGIRKIEIKPRGAGLS